MRQAREQLKGIEDEYPGASWLPVVCQHPAAVPPVWPELNGAKTAPVSIGTGTVVTRARGSHRWWLKRRVAIAAALAGCLVLGFWLAGPLLSKAANQQGNNNLNRGQISRAVFYYRLSRWLNPRFPVPSYNLGSLCEDIFNDLDCARREYHKALKLGLPEAGAQLAKLQVRDGEGDAARKHIRYCLDFTSYKAVKSACLKNRAWQRFKEQRFSEAETDLRNAIHLEKDSPHAYCLLAQVLDAQKREAEATEIWETAQRLAQNHEYLPELDDCLRLANQRLQSQEALP